MDLPVMPTIKPMLAKATKSMPPQSAPELVELLAEESLPVADRRDALRGFGVHRIYVDNPTIRVEFAT